MTYSRFTTGLLVPLLICTEGFEDCAGCEADCGACPAGCAGGAPSCQEASDSLSIPDLNAACDALAKIGFGPSATADCEGGCCVLTGGGP